MNECREERGGRETTGGGAEKGGEEVAEGEKREEPLETSVSSESHVPPSTRADEENTELGAEERQEKEGKEVGAAEGSCVGCRLEGVGGGLSFFVEYLETPPFKVNDILLRPSSVSW